MLRRNLLSLSLFTAALSLGLPAWAATRALHSERAGLTTEFARKLVLDRIAEIERTRDCRYAFDAEQIDLSLLRAAVLRTRFYSAGGGEGNLKFSETVGQAASPDRTLRELATEVPADAFVLGYQDGERYVRTAHVVLSRGFFQLMNPSDGSWRFTTLQERQDLLLHEILHIALDQDDHQLDQLLVCPLRELAACARSSRSQEAVAASDGG